MTTPRRTIVQAAASLQAGDQWLGVASGRTDGEPLAIEQVGRSLKGRIRVTFEGGIVRTYEPGRRVVIVDDGTPRKGRDLMAALEASLRAASDDVGSDRG